MLFAYMTTDEVNQNQALQLAAECGIDLRVLWPKDPPPDGQFDALVYDLDFWPEWRRQQVLASLLAGEQPHLTGVHSYALDEKHTELLRTKGVLVYRRLERDLFVKLRALAASAR
jgi:hypothetical protein